MSRRQEGPVGCRPGPPFDFQPTLISDLIHVRPLHAADFDDLYAVAADPVIWEQHPQQNRHQETYLDISSSTPSRSGGALAVVDTRDGRLIGSSRYHSYDAECSEIEIGWTFLARSHWGGAYNKELKRLMLRHAFASVGTVVFLIGPTSLRSQRSVEKIGGVRSGTRPDGSGSLSLLYRIESRDWPEAAA